MGLLDTLKQERKEDKQRSEDAKKRKVVLKLKDGDVARIRFLSEIDDAVSLSFHDAYSTVQEDSVQAMCGADFNLTCYWCDVAVNWSKKSGLETV